jgi:hypothetical protein
VGSHDDDVGADAAGRVQELSRHRALGEGLAVGHAQALTEGGDSLQHSPAFSRQFGPDPVPKGREASLGQHLRAIHDVAGVELTTQ